MKRTVEPELMSGEEQARAYESPDDVRRWYYQSPDRLREIESVVLEANQRPAITH